MNRIFQKIKEIIKKNPYFYIVIKNISAYAIYFINRISNYQMEKIRFYKKLGYTLNLKNPQSFSEKIIWKKIYDKNPLLPITADKYLVRSYIKQVLGEEKANEILIPLLYVTDKPDSIPFESLPPSFIIKPNHASGLVIIVENNQYDKKEIIQSCQRWLSTPYGLEKLEWAYQSIKRKIIIENLLSEEDGGILKNFRLHMFHGKCKLVNVFFDGPNESASRSFYDEKWNILPIRKLSNPRGIEIEKPKNYEEMLYLAEKISYPFDYIRVDCYNINGKVYIGELTHYPTSGLGRFEPGSFDFELGKNWRIKKEYWK